MGVSPASASPAVTYVEIDGWLPALLILILLKYYEREYEKELILGEIFVKMCLCDFTHSYVIMQHINDTERF